MFIYRPEYYKIDEFEDGEPADGKAEIIIAKHRNGSLENVKLKFIKNFTKFANLDSDDDFGGVITPNADFGSETSNSITRLSKMDDIDEDDDSPF